MIKELISKVVENNNLSIEEMEKAMNIIMDGEATPAQVASFITALRMKGETVEEITGAAKVMRYKATKIHVSQEKKKVLDTCGTGGDKSHTFNISTATAIVLASLGITVAKHGNRSVTSSCGSADVLKALGVNIEISKEKVEECIEKVNIGFLFAPKLHSAMKYAIGPRREIGIRTIFNVLGPLTNPAEAKYQLLGVFNPDIAKLMIGVLKNLGGTSAMVVHGGDGLDEITTTTTTDVWELKNGNISNYKINPEEYGIKLVSKDDLRGGEPDYNAQIIKEIFDGKEGAKTDAVLINAGASCYITGLADSIKDGIEMTKEVLKNGKTKETLEKFIDISNS